MKLTVHKFSCFLIDGFIAYNRSSIQQTVNKFNIRFYVFSKAACNAIKQGSTFSSMKGFAYSAFPPCSGVISLISGSYYTHSLNGTQLKSGSSFLNAVNHSLHNDPFPGGLHLFCDVLVCQSRCRGALRFVECGNPSLVSPRKGFSVCGKSQSCSVPITLKESWS